MAKKCPLLGKECIECGCNFWTHIIGMNPQTAKPVDHFNCAISWLPILLTENSKETRNVTANLVEFKNRVVEGNQNLLGLVNPEPDEVKERLLESAPKVEGE